MSSSEWVLLPASDQEELEQKQQQQQQQQASNAKYQSSSRAAASHIPSAALPASPEPDPYHLLHEQLRPLTDEEKRGPPITDEDEDDDDAELSMQEPAEPLQQQPQQQHASTRDHQPSTQPAASHRPPTAQHVAPKSDFAYQDPQQKSAAALQADNSAGSMQPSAQAVMTHRPSAAQHASPASSPAYQESPQRRRIVDQDHHAALRMHQRAVLWAQCGVLLMLFLWFLAILAGYVDHADSDEKPPRELKLPLLWFDRLLLRRFGPFLPFIIVAMRVSGNLPACSIHGRPISKQRLAILYGSITLGRWLLYLIHSAELLNWVNRIFPAHVAASDHMMSDHVFLTSSIAAIFLCEFTFLLHNFSYMTEWLVVPRSMKRQWRQALGALTLCILLHVLVVLDTYYSARYFHWRTHNNSAAFLGFVAFQIPVLALLG